MVKTSFAPKAVTKPKAKTKPTSKLAGTESCSAAGSSKFPSDVSARIKKQRSLNPGHLETQLQTCHLIPVGQGDEWLPLMHKMYGQGVKFWTSKRNTAENGVALIEPVHRCFDIDQADARVAFLPPLAFQDAKLKKVTKQEVLLLQTHPGSGPWDYALLRCDVRSVQAVNRGFTSRLTHGYTALCNQGVPPRFLKVAAFFEPAKTVEVKEAVRTHPNIAKSVAPQLAKMLSDFIIDRGDRNLLIKCRKLLKQSDGSARVLLKGLKADFVTTRGLHARALRLLQHPDFKDLENGGSYNGSGSENVTDGNPRVEREPVRLCHKMDLVQRACHDSAVAAGLIVAAPAGSARKTRKALSR